MDVMSSKVLGSVEIVYEDAKGNRMLSSSPHSLNDGPEYVTNPFKGDCLKSCKVIKAGESFPMEKRTVRNYGNFMKSGLPQRLLFYKNSEWNDFSTDIIRLMRDDFHAKKAIIEVTCQDQQFLLDFVRMLLIDSKTGLSKPLAWIDVHGKCFFPEIYSEFCVTHGNHLGENVHAASVPICTRELGSHLDTFVSASENSNSGFPHYKDKKTKRNKVILENNPMTMMGEVVGENDLCISTSSHAVNFGMEQKNATAADSSQLSCVSVRRFFLSGMYPYVDAKGIVNISRAPTSDESGKFLVSSFRKHIEITKKHRGTANVRYAWLPAKKSAVEEMMLRGVMRVEKPVHGSAYGLGIYLAPVNCPNTW